MLVAAVLAVGAGPLVGCGEDRDARPAGGSQEQSASRATDSERAFLQAMVAHHQSAIQMARIGQQRAESPEMRQLAGGIVRAQRAEIGELQRIHRRLFGEPLRPDPAAHDRLGLSAEQAGMTHAADDMAMLERADPFDRTFVDMMAPHHAGAVRLARALLLDSRDQELRARAQAIMRDQRREMAEMDAFRKREFGAGVPPAPAADQGGEGGGHSGHG